MFTHNQPTLATEMGSFQEQITSTRNGSITSIQAVYVPADDMTDPAPATTFIHLDATTVLARSLAAKGIYPAVDVLDSTSKVSQRCHQRAALCLSLASPSAAMGSSRRPATQTRPVRQSHKSPKMNRKVRSKTRPKTGLKPPPRRRNPNETGKSTSEGTPKKR
jgi:hypothetical protein